MRGLRQIVWSHSESKFCLLIFCMAIKLVFDHISIMSLKVLALCCVVYFPELSQNFELLPSSKTSSFDRTL